MKDLNKKIEKDLNKMIAEKRESLRNFRFGSSGSKIKNVKEGNTLKKDIARIFTELRKREIENEQS